MNKLITILAIAFTMGLSAQTDTWEFKADKQMHFMAGVGISYISADLMGNKDRFSDFDRVAVPIFASVFIGAGKEVYDLHSKKGNPSMHDFGYTVIGGVIGTFAKYGVEKILDHRRNKRQIKI